MDLLKRIFISTVISSMMFFALRYLGFSVSASLAFSLIPLLLGSINVLTGFAHSLTAVVLVLALATALFPDWEITGSMLLQSISQEMSEKKKAR